MLKLNDVSAFTNAVEIAKIVCANQSVEIVPSKQSAEDLANFIRTLEARFKEGN